MTSDLGSFSFASRPVFGIIIVPEYDKRGVFGSRDSSRPVRACKRLTNGSVMKSLGKTAEDTEDRMSKAPHQYLTDKAGLLSLLVVHEFGCGFVSRKDSWCGMSSGGLRKRAHLSAAEHALLPALQC
jgi:hypothetical protein